VIQYLPTNEEKMKTLDEILSQKVNNVDVADGADKFIFSLNGEEVVVVVHPGKGDSPGEYGFAPFD